MFLEFLMYLYLLVWSLVYHGMSAIVSALTNSEAVLAVVLNRISLTFRGKCVSPSYQARKGNEQTVCDFSFMNELRLQHPLVQASSSLSLTPMRCSHVMGPTTPSTAQAAECLVWKSQTASRQFWPNTPSTLTE